MAQVNIYAKGLAPVFDTGAVQAAPDRIILRAVLRSDFRDSPLQVAVMSVADSAVAWEVMAVGPGVEGISVGAHVDIDPTAAHAAELTDAQNRWFVVHKQEVNAYWSPVEVAGIMEAIEHERQSQEDAALAAIAEERKLLRAGGAA